MSGRDKASNKTQATKGKVKESLGNATGNRRMQGEGQKDRTKGNVKQAGEKVKDAFKK